MERGVIVGGVLIGVSLLLAVILNSTASREALAIDANAVEQSPSDGVPAQENRVDTKQSAPDNGDHGDGIKLLPSDLAVRETWSQADEADGRR